MAPLPGTRAPGSPSEGPGRRACDSAETGEWQGPRQACPRAPRTRGPGGLVAPREPSVSFRGHRKASRVSTCERHLVFCRFHFDQPSPEAAVDPGVTPRSVPPPELWF